MDVQSQLLAINYKRINNYQHAELAVDLYYSVHWCMVPLSAAAG